MYFRWKNTLAISPWHCHQQLSKVQVILRHILLQRKQQEDQFQLEYHQWQLEEHRQLRLFPLLNHLHMDQQQAPGMHQNLDRQLAHCQINRPIEIIPEMGRSVVHLILIHTDQLALHLNEVMEVARKILEMLVHIIHTTKM